MIRIAALAAVLCVAAHAQVPRPEHPRPDMMRAQWVNLNGDWQFDFDDADAGRAQNWMTKETWGRTITVPFPWQAPLSGIAATEEHPIGWYSRTFAVPTDWKGQRVLLHFGALDWHADVWINGSHAGEHDGGYTPFAVDITELLIDGAQTVVVRAEDYTRRDQPTGKQIGWYTPTSGIWQTVWLEAHPATSIGAVHITPDVANARAQIKVTVQAPAAGKATLTIRTDPDETASAALPEQRFDLIVKAGTSEHNLTLNVPDPQLWSPDIPNLYFIRIELKPETGDADVLHTYFGMRTISTGKFAGQDFTYVTLNGEPIYLMGALDQAFHPDGIYTYPSDDVIRNDLKATKEFGLNFLRLHIKLDEPRFLYWADRMGVLIMADMPNFWDWSDDALPRYETMLREAVARDYNHPAIFSWVLFNETWGLGSRRYVEMPERQAWVASMFQLAKSLDGTRLIEDNSACLYDHVVSDINSWHFYINNYETAKRHIQKVVDDTYPGSGFNCVPGKKQAGAPLMNSEYGGISAGMGDQDVAWCFKFLTNELRKHAKIAGYIYTELQDIEWEHNGYLNYDRSRKVFGYDAAMPDFSIASLNSPDFLVMDCPPYQEIKPGENIEIPLSFSHFSGKSLKSPRVRWFLNGPDDLTLPMSRPMRGGWPISATPWTVTPAGKLSLTIADTPRLYTLVAVVEDEGKVIATNYVNFGVDASRPRLRRHHRFASTVLLSWDPGEVYDSSWPELMLGAAETPEKVWGEGAGWIEYRIQLPESLPFERILAESKDGPAPIALFAELSAKAGDEKIDWPRRRPSDYPQTDANRQWPTRFNVYLNGVRIHSGTLADDPADARGVLSHARGLHPGSYGYIGANSAIVLPLEALKKTEGRQLVIRFEVPEDAEPAGGLAIFGDGMGRFPLDPTLAFTTSATVEASYDSPAHVRTRGTVIIPTAEDSPTTWKYIESEPKGSWQAPSYDDSAWKQGNACFGREDTPGARISTPWTSDDIWLRREFDLNSTPRAARLRLHHDDAVEVYLNGQRILSRRGWTRDYGSWTLPGDARALLQPGKNTIAVYCHQDDGGQYIDVGLTVLE